MSRETDMVRDRDHLIDRLQHLRAIVPVFAQELASARRQAAQLRMENGRLIAELRRLQRQSSAPESSRASVGVISNLDIGGAKGPSAELTT